MTPAWITIPMTPPDPRQLRQILRHSITYRVYPHEHTLLSAHKVTHSQHDAISNRLGLSRTSSRRHVNYDSPRMPNTRHMTIHASHSYCLISRVVRDWVCHRVDQVWLRHDFTIPTTHQLLLDRVYCIMHGISVWLKPDVIAWAYCLMLEMAYSLWGLWTSLG